MQNLQMKPKVYDLIWEKEKIGIDASKVNLTHGIKENEWDELIEEFNDYELVVINNIGNNSKNNLLIGNLENSFVADINVQFEKVPCKVIDEKNNSVKIVNNKDYDDDLVKIAEKSFLVSRFTIDPNFNSEKTRLVYVDWTKNSFNKQDKYFVTYEVNNERVGFIVFSFNQDIATVELVAVHTDYQNKRVGRAMITELERFIYEERKDISLIRVGTQSENEAAIRFYQKRGFRVVKLNTIYHYWNKNLR